MVHLVLVDPLHEIHNEPVSRLAISVSVSFLADLWLANAVHENDPLEERFQQGSHVGVEDIEPRLVHAKESSRPKQRDSKRALDDDQRDDVVSAQSDGYATMSSVLKGQVIPVGIEGDVTFMFGVGCQEMILPVFISAKRGQQSSGAPYHLATAASMMALQWAVIHTDIKTFTL